MPNSPASPSKALNSGDESGADFARELLQGDPTFAINFDRLQYDPTEGRYIIFEFLLCEEKQAERGITPFSSHPRRYWHKNKRKFLSLWKAAQKLEARLFLVNYAKKDSPYADEILVIEVLEMDEKGISREKVGKINRAKFSQWFREMNKRCAG